MAPQAAGPRWVVAVGASAGGLEPLARFVAGLPPDFAAAVLIVLHVGRKTPSVLPRILARHAALPVESALDRSPLLRGHVYVAPSDHHLLVRDGEIVVIQGPEEHGHRPAVDPLFRSVARAYGPGSIAIVLSGALDDGTSGALAVRRCGGLVAIQDPAEAEVADMPSSVQNVIAVDASLPVDELTEWVVTTVGKEPMPWPEGVEAGLEYEDAIAELAPDALVEPQPGAVPSSLSCPACNGVLWEVSDDAVLRFRCRVGHAWTGESLAVEHDRKIENAVWEALRILQEAVELDHRIERRAGDRGHDRVVARIRRRRFERQRAAERLRDALTARPTTRANRAYDR
jgi:two-component system chemotaxis response regulator CheB